MGRHYTGDINGKFWFAVQSSDDADFFGVQGTEPNCLQYYFDRENLPKVLSGINKCEKALGKHKKELDEFFSRHNGYNEEMIEKELKIGIKKVRELLVWYARLELGKKIEKCIRKNDVCTFDAEL